MIPKISKGCGFDGAISYVSEKPEAQYLFKNNLLTDNFKGEMRAIADSASTQCKNPVFHCSLSLPPSERLSDERWEQIAESYLKKMGFDLEKTQYAAWRHSDNGKDHIHLIVNRVDMTGAVWQDNHDYARSMLAARAVEKEHGLTQLQQHQEQSYVGRIASIKNRINAAINSCDKSEMDLKTELSKNGVKMRVLRQSTGRVSGVMFSETDSSQKGREFKGSQISRDFSASGLKKLGIEFENHTIKIKAGLKDFEPRQSAALALDYIAAGAIADPSQSDKQQAGIEWGGGSWTDSDRLKAEVEFSDKRAEFRLKRKKRRKVKAVF